MEHSSAPSWAAILGHPALRSPSFIWLARALFSVTPRNLSLYQLPGWSNTKTGVAPQGHGLRVCSIINIKKPISLPQELYHKISLYAAATRFRWNGVHGERFACSASKKHQDGRGEGNPLYRFTGGGISCDHGRSYLISPPLGDRPCVCFHATRGNLKHSVLGAPGLTDWFCRRRKQCKTCVRNIDM